MKGLALADPGLWRVKQKLLETSVNPEVLPPIIEALSYIWNTTKYGNVHITIKNGKVTITEGNIHRKLNLEIVEFDNMF